MSGLANRGKFFTQLALVLAATYAVFQFTLYLWLNSPTVAQQRMDRSNAAIVEQVAAIYRANRWPGMGGQPELTELQAAEPADATLAAAPRGDDCDCFCADD